MRFFRKKREPRNMMVMTPSRLVEWETGTEDNIVLKIPKFRGKLGKIFLPRMKAPYYRVNLDKLGSFVWRGIEGETTVHEILEAIRAEFGGGMEDSAERLGLFLRKLKDAKAISLE